jgi:predicted ATPase
MITKIEISGFKTFENFTLNFSPFVVVAGTNASGKSNLFDAIRLISKLSTHDLRTSFSDQRGSFKEMFTTYSPTNIASEISIAVELFLDSQISDEYNRTVDLSHRRLRYELGIKRTKDTKSGLEKLVVAREVLRAMKRGEDDWFKETISGTKWEPSKKSNNYKPYINTEIKDDIQVISLRTDGIRGGRPTPIRDLERTVLSGVNDSSFPHAFAVKREMQEWKIFQLNPAELAKPSPMLGKDRLDVDGRFLAAMVKKISMDEPMALRFISLLVRAILPDIKSISVEEDRLNQQYVLIAKGLDGRTFSSKVLSEGTLRIIALVALLHDDRHKGLLCFEEPENGIHPLRLKEILDVLNSLSTDFNQKTDLNLPLRQVLVNTHSPELIKAVTDNDDFKETMIYFSKLNTKIDSKKKNTYKITRMSLVNNDGTKRLFLKTLPAEASVSKHELYEYLNSSNIY